MNAKSSFLKLGFVMVCFWVILTGTGHSFDFRKLFKPTPSQPNNSPTSGPTPGTSGSGHGPQIDGEKFATRPVVDQQQGGLVMGVFSVPEKWAFNSQVRWDYGRINCPVMTTVSAVNPAAGEVFTLFLPLQFVYVRPDVNLAAGQDMAGFIFTHGALSPVQTLTGFIQQMRRGMSKLTFVGSKELPELPAALRLPDAKNQKGVGIRITYEDKGQPFEEEFYGSYYSTTVPYDGPQGRTFQVNWGLQALHSFRAPGGTLDKRRPVFAAIAKSFRPNPAWQRRDVAINDYLQEMFNAQMQAGYERIAAAGRVSKLISANNDAMLATIDQRLTSSRYSAPTNAGSRGSTANFDDYIRGVDTVEDPYYGTSQHSYTQEFHWTDGYGSYRNSNNAGYDPNQTEVGNWQLMQPIR